MNTLIILLAMLIAPLFGTTAPPAEPVAFMPLEDGYTGERVAIPQTTLEFCLPDGWTKIEAPDGILFIATYGDSAALDIYMESAEGFSPDQTVNGWNVMIRREGEDTLKLSIPYEEELLTFHFAANSIAESDACAIIASISDNW